MPCIPHLNEIDINIPFITGPYEPEEMSSKNVDVAIPIQTSIKVESFEENDFVHILLAPGRLSYSPAWISPGCCLAIIPTCLLSCPE